jgi:hypothetical protein
MKSIFLTLSPLPRTPVSGVVTLRGLVETERLENDHSKVTLITAEQKVFNELEAANPNCFLADA